MPASTTRAPGLRVPRTLGQTAIQLAARLTLLDKGLMINRVNTDLILPLRRPPSCADIRQCDAVLDEFTFVSTHFAPKKGVPDSLLKALRGILPPELFNDLPKSMDLVGQVAIIKIPPPLAPWKHHVGQAVLQVNRNVETVLARVGPIDGEHRVSSYEVVAGTGRTATRHKEYGCIYYVDPQVAYFSPRLSEERQRVARQVQEGETVVDMFASVGAYAIQIAKLQTNTVIYAIDVNEQAFHFLTQNIRVNRVVDRVFPFLGDIRQLRHEFAGVADRVIMDLPEQAWAFLDVACSLLKPQGGILHLYAFESDPHPLQHAVQRLPRHLSKSKRSLGTIIAARRVRSIAPRKWQIVLDALIN